MSKLGEFKKYEPEELTPEQQADMDAAVKEMEEAEERTEKEKKACFAAKIHTYDAGLGCCPHCGN